MNKFVASDIAEVFINDIYWITCPLFQYDRLNVVIQVHIPAPLTPKHINWDWVFYSGYCTDEELFEICYSDIKISGVLGFLDERYTIDDIKYAIGYHKKLADFEYKVTQRALDQFPDKDNVDQITLEAVMDFSRDPLIFHNFSILKPSPPPKSGIKLPRFWLHIMASFLQPERYYIAQSPDNHPYRWKISF
jgi:hypothetical protein